MFCSERGKKKGRKKFPPFAISILQRCLDMRDTKTENFKPCVGVNQMREIPVETVPSSGAKNRLRTLVYITDNPSNGKRMRGSHI